MSSKPASVQDPGLPLKDWLLLASLYVTQFIGIGFFMIALVAILRQQGMSLQNISWVYGLGFFSVFRFLWAPLVDRWRLPGGHYRGWLLGLQSAMVLVLVAISRFDLQLHMFSIMSLCLLLAFLSATQDIAVDGLACKLLNNQTRGLGNGVQMAAGLLGNLIGGGLVLVFYQYWGWQYSMWLMATITALSLLQLLGFREPQQRTDLQPIGFYLTRLWRFWHQGKQGLWFLMLLIYPLGVCLAHALIAPMLVDSQWSLAEIGFAMNVMGSLVGLTAALLTGVLIGRYGRKSALVAGAVLQMLAIAALIPPFAGFTHKALLWLSLSTFYLAYSPVLVVLACLMMDKASTHSPATDYSLQFSLYLLIGFVASALGTSLAAQFGYLQVLVVALISAFVSIGMALLYNSPESEQQQREGALDNHFLNVNRGQG